jgi:hypothetical protein
MTVGIELRVWDGWLWSQLMVRALGADTGTPASGSATVRRFSPPFDPDPDPDPDPDRDAEAPNPGLDREPECSATALRATSAGSSSNEVLRSLGSAISQLPEAYRGSLTHANLNGTLWRRTMGRLRPVLPLLALAGCSTLQSATDTITNTKNSIDQGKQTYDQEKQKTHDETAKAKGKKGKDGKGGDGGGPPEDDDGDRLHAKECQINTPIDDKVDAQKGDKFDWRKVTLLGRPGVATFELHWDEEAANLDVDIYDAYGTNVGRSPPRMEGAQVKRVLVEIPQPGLYYIRVSAPGPKDTSIYTLSIKWKGPPAPIVVAPPPPPPAPPPAAPAAPPPPAAPVPLGADPNKVLGTIITAYREGGGWVLFLDKGVQDKLRPGLLGQIFEGQDGEKLLSGSDFTISQVIDQNKSIAKSAMTRAPGKNKRFVVHLR